MVSTPFANYRAASAFLRSLGFANVGGYFRGTRGRLLEGFKARIAGADGDYRIHYLGQG